MNALKAAAVIVICLIVVIGLQRLVGSAQLPQRAKKGGEATVIVEAAGEREFSDRIEALGTATANESVTITATVSDLAAKVCFTDGAVVKAGEVLVELESAEEQAALEEAKVNLAEARRELKRVTSLREQKVASEQELDTRRSAVEASEARLLAAQARLQDRSLRAPFAGVLGLRRISPGALVGPGTVITTLDDLSVIKADFAVPETFLAALQPGQAVEARSVAWPDVKFTGTVSQIDSRVDPNTRAVTVQAKIPNPDGRLHPGMLLTIELFSRVRRSLGIPEKALVAFAEKQFVYVLQAAAGQSGPKVQKRAVRLGRRDAGWVEIVEGLAAGEKVVVEGLMDLQDGSVVRLAETGGDQPKPEAKNQSQKDA